MLWSPQLYLPMGKKPAVAAGGLGLQTSLSAFWQFENTSWTDELGSNNLTGTNSPTSDAAGKVGNAVKFASGSSMELHHADASALQLAGGSFSIQVWVDLASGNALSDLSILSKNDGGFGNREYAIGTAFISSNIWTWSLWTNTGQNERICNSTVTVSGGFHHIVCTWDGTTQKIYVDNSSPDTNTPGATGTSSTSSLLIGKDGNGGTFASAGQNVFIDQVGLWKGRALSAADVSLLYNGGSGLSYAAMA